MARFQCNLVGFEVHTNFRCNAMYIHNKGEGVDKDVEKPNHKTQLGVSNYKLQ